MTRVLRDTLQRHGVILESRAGADGLGERGVADLKRGDQHLGGGRRGVEGGEKGHGGSVVYRCRQAVNGGEAGGSADVLLSPK